MVDEKDQKTQASPASSSAGPVSSSSKPASSPSTSGSRDLKGAELDRARRTGYLSGTTTEAQQEEYEELGINPALDNRIGDQRPYLPKAVKPQQIDGPEVGYFAEHAEKHAKDMENVLGTDVDGGVMGHRAEGPHGRGWEK